MIQTIENELTPNPWVTNANSNAEVVAAHEKTIFIHKVALDGARQVFSNLNGDLAVGTEHSIEWGRVHSFGPTCTWASMKWTSQPIKVGELEDNDLGVDTEFIVLSLAGIIESRKNRSLMHPKGIMAKSIFDEHYMLKRMWGRIRYEDRGVIPHPHKKPLCLDTVFSCRDVRSWQQAMPDNQIKDYELRTKNITAFMDELLIMVQNAKLGIISDLKFSSDHVSAQTKAMSLVDQKRYLFNR